MSELISQFHNEMTNYLELFIRQDENGVYRTSSQGTKSRKGTYINGVAKKPDVSCFLYFISQLESLGSNPPY